MDEADDLTETDRAMEVMARLPRNAALLVAVNTILARTFGNVILETCLYRLREGLTEAEPTDGETEAHGPE